MPEPLPLKGRSQRVSCAKNTSDLYLLQADIYEGIGQVTEFEIEFLSEKTTLKPEDFLADVFTLEMDIDDGDVRKWYGTCVECTYVGMSEGMGYGEYQHFKVLLRGWPWLLSRIVDSKIYQEQNADDIVKSVFSEYGFSDVTWNVSKTPPVREYCVQYRETCWEFVQRLLAEEGRFWFFDYSTEKDQLVIRDDSAGLSPISGEAKIELIDKEAGAREAIDYIDNWLPVERVETDKVTLKDYDFTKSQTSLEGTRQGSTAKYEDYDYPGLFSEAGDGTSLARRKMESISARTKRVRGRGIVKQLYSGGKFTLDKHPTEAQNVEHIALNVHHSLRLERVDDSGEPQSVSDSALRDEGGHRTLTRQKLKIEDPAKLMESHSVLFEAQPASLPYVPPMYPVPAPKVHGVQTAEVVGPSGEEIYTDEYGRVKVQFHWDRDGQKDENTTCFIRVATPIAGKSWGMIHIPRIGQEVVVQFLEGNPDRPLIVGSVYNDQQTVPFGLPDNKTRIGLVSDTHKNEDAAAKHELWFEEKKDEEVLRMQSERDWDVNIKNSALVNIGTEEKPDGDYEMKVWRHTTRSYGEGSGEGDVTETVQNNFTKTVLDGDYTLGVDSGSRITTIATDDTLTIDGNAEETVGGTKDITVTGALTIKSDASITLECGGSTIEMTPSAITISSTQVDIAADAAATMKGMNTEVSGSAMLTLKGGIVKIN